MKVNIEEMLSEARIVKIDSNIARKAGDIRLKGKDKGYKIKLPDALIAATAIIEKGFLVTHNISNFLKIAQFENLHIIDPAEVKTKDKIKGKTKGKSKKNA